MNLNISVQFQNALAYYTVTREAEEVYLATLERIEGDPICAPPAKLTLTRGIRRWTGSIDDTEVLNALGRAVEGASVVENLSMPGAVDARSSQGYRGVSQ